MSDDTNIHVLYNLAISALGLLLGITGFFVVRLIKQFDHKADKDEVKDIKEDIRDLITKIDKISETQTNRHEANTARLDNILLRINGIKNGG